MSPLSAFLGFPKRKPPIYPYELASLGSEMSGRPVGRSAGWALILAFKRLLDHPIISLFGK